MARISRRDAARALTRRETLRGLMLGAAAIPMAGLLGRAARPAWADGETRAAAAPRAKAVIEIWMWGGPSHNDTFDPKPEAGRDICGPLNQALRTNADGMRIGSLLPQLAKQADKYSLIRSMTHGVNGHETATYIAQTGRTPGGRLVYPGIGAVVSRFRGYDAGYEGLIPPYVTLTNTKGRFSETGFLGPRYRPFATGGDPNQKRFLVEGVVAPGISDERQKNRRDLKRDLDTLGGAMLGNRPFERLDACEENAYDLILGDAGKLFDLSGEKDELRNRYGRTRFGQSCLMARRLVEHGIPYVTINSTGWDTHKQHFEIMRRKLPDLDRGLATLLADLSDRGLLDSTVVWCAGEFGRTPRVQWQPPWNGGRSHFGRCYSALVAGGGFLGGHVVGASNATGEEVRDRPVHPRDLLGSVYELLGIDPDGPLPNDRGLDVRVTEQAADAGKGGGRLREIMRNA